MDITLIISGGILIGCLIALSWFAGSDAPYIPTKMDQIRKILKLAGVKKEKKFYELGSGDGRVVLEAAKLGADSIGIEQSWLRVLYSRYKTLRLASQTRSGNVKFYHGDLFNQSFWSEAIESRSYRSAKASLQDDKNKSIANADIVYIFLLPKGVAKLEDKLKKELKKGSIIITQTYHFPTWKPFKKLDNFWFYRN